jgi:hypothetical protein
MEAAPIAATRGYSPFDMRRRPRSARDYIAMNRLRAFASLLFASAGFIVLWPMWLDRSPVEGQFENGYFEELDGAVRLVADRDYGTMLPGNGLLDDELTVMPGSSILLPLLEHTEYVIENQIQALAPYVAIGSKNGNVLTTPAVLTVSGGALQLLPWNPSLPWGGDRSRLTAIRRECRGDLALRVEAAHQVVHLRIGQCSVSMSTNEATALASHRRSRLGNDQARGWMETPCQNEFHFHRRMLVHCGGSCLFSRRPEPGQLRSGGSRSAGSFFLVS